MTEAPGTPDPPSGSQSGSTEASAKRGTLGNGRYELQGLIGGGSSGEVHRAQDVATGLVVALKRLRTPDPEEAYHLKREFRALADIRHPNLARVYDLFIDEDECFFTMELVEGDDPRVFLASHADPRDRTAAVLDLLPQLVAAVRAVHALGIVHRDLKPANILLDTSVASSPRLVLIDFGLLAPTVPDLRDAHDLAGLSGTIAYMAPEQLRGGAVGEAADWYAAGATVFELLVDRPAFEGSAARIAQAKIEGVRPSIPPDLPLPAWLQELVVALLDGDSRKRPEGTDIERRLRESGASREAAGPPASPTSFRRSAGWSAVPTAESPLFGRDRERAELDAALSRAVAGAVVVARVHGSSGIGKSELLQRFTSAAQSQSGVVVLRGRCHAYETIPRKGLDQVVDDLSRFLQIDDSACESIGEEAAAALLRLFPVLGRVPALARRSGPASDIDPQRLKRTGVRAFAQILGDIARRQPLLLWIDDVQWAEGESAELLETCLEHPGLERMMTVLSYRPEADPDSPMLAILSSGAPRRYESVAIHLEPLSESAARRMVETLAASVDLPGRIDLDRIVAEGAGSPFFLGELVRSVSIPGTGEQAGAPAAVPRIDEVVGRRYDALPELSRELLDVLSLAGAPLAEETTVSAIGQALARHVVGELERLCLVRTLDTPTGRRVQPWHDRIAEGVRSRLDPSRRVALHGRIADALEGASLPDYELLVAHCRDAGQMARAARHAVPAADRAARALAFERAADLYALAREHADDNADHDAILLGLAEALANAGRGAESGAAFEDAAVLLSGREPGNTDAVELRRRGAEQLLRCGQIDEGIARIRDVLSVFGERLPSTAGEAMRSFLWQRARLLLRGTTARPCAPAAADSPDLTRLNAMWSTTIAVSMVDLGLAGALQVRHFLAALDLGDPDRLALAFAHEATWRAAIGGRTGRGAQAALEQARRGITQSDAPYPRAWTTMAEGIVCWLSGRFSRSYPLLESALEQYRGRCQGVFFETALTVIYDFTALAMSGRILRLSDLVHEEMADARRRRDRFAHHGCLMGETVFAWLGADDPDTAIAQADLAIDEWPKDRFLMQHYHHLLTTAQARLYRGEGSAAYAGVEAVWPQLGRGGYLWLECPALELHFLRARAALEAAADAGSSRDRRRLLKVAAASARVMERSALPPAAGFAAGIRAGLATANGRREQARRHLREAWLAYETADMRMHAAAVALALDSGADDDPGRRPGEEALAWALQEGCRDMERLGRSLVPLPAA